MRLAGLVSPLAGATIAFACFGCGDGRPVRSPAASANEAVGNPGGGPGGPTPTPGITPTPAVVTTDPTLMLVGFELENDYCALKSGGRLRCWTDNDYWDHTLEPLVAKAPPGLVQIAASDTISSDPLFCGIDTAGNGTCWGANTNIDMGGGLASLVLTRYGPCALFKDGRLDCSRSGISTGGLPRDRRYVQIDVAADFIIALDENGTPLNDLSPLLTLSGVYRRVATIGTGAALRDDGALVQITYPEPLVIPGAFVDLHYDRSRLCGIDGAGEITCFQQQGAPSPPLTPPAGPFKQIASGWSTMCGLRANGTTACWGEVPVHTPDGW
jgi:hypothetical protein